MLKWGNKDTARQRCELDRPPLASTDLQRSFHEVAESVGTVALAANTTAYVSSGFRVRTDERRGTMIVEEKSTVRVPFAQHIQALSHPQNTHQEVSPLNGVYSASEGAHYSNSLQFLPAHIHRD